LELSREYECDSPSYMRLHSQGALPYVFSEGVHAKYHYLVCGVQGDFTRGLVDNPPTSIWTRQMKVRHGTMCSNVDSDPAVISLLVSQIHRLCIKEVYVCAQAQASGQRCQLVYR
jgi:hypothetical protein